MLLIVLIHQITCGPYLHCVKLMVEGLSGLEFTENFFRFMRENMKRALQKVLERFSILESEGKTKELHIFQLVSVSVRPFYTFSGAQFKTGFCETCGILQCHVSPKQDNSCIKKLNYVCQIG